MLAAARKTYYDAVAPASKTYDDAVAPARKTYDDAVAAARKYDAVAAARKYDAVAAASKTYDDAVAPASKTYDDAVAPASKTRDDAVALASKTYDDAVAAALMRAIRMEWKGESKWEEARRMPAGRDEPNYPWWQWPRTEARHYFVPWYTIAARVPGMLILMVGRVIYVAGVFLAFGVNRARSAWRDTE